MDPGEVAGIAAVADEIERQGQVSWPELRVPRAAVLECAGRIAGAAPDVARFGHEVYLACACARADPAALRIFERVFMPSIDRALARFNLPQAERDEFGQRLRVRLFTGERPHIAEYGGRGPLAAWLRTIVFRDAAKIVGPERQRDRQHEQDDADHLVSALADPEVAALRQSHRERFQRALDESILALSPRAKTVLRLHYVEGLNIDAIGAAFRVHRATVARWISLSRALVVANLRGKLSDLRLSASDVHSLSGALLGDLHISVDRVLRSEGGDGTGDKAGGVTAGFVDQSDHR